MGGLVESLIRVAQTKSGKPHALPFNASVSGVLSIRRAAVERQVMEDLERAAELPGHTSEPFPRRGPTDVKRGGECRPERSSAARATACVGS